MKDLINMTSGEIFSIIDDSLKFKEALAITRFGDGEAMFLKGNDDDRNFLTKRQIGRNFNQNEKEVLIENLTYTFLNSNIIGIPPLSHQELGGFWKESINVLEEFGITEKINNFGSINLHFDFLEFLKDKTSFLYDLENLYYISSRNLDEKLKSTFRIKNVYSFIIAPEIKFTPNYKGKSHYPEQFEEVKEWIKSKGNLEGQFCLVGAGLVGKIYNVWFKEQGGVSMDIGSVFDIWDGRVTRGPKRGPNVLTEEGKL